MRSGIGPPNDLRRVGLDVAVDLPGVGANLLDHPLVIDGLGSYRVAAEAAPAGAPPPFLPLILLARRRGGTEEIDLGIMVGQALERRTSDGAARQRVFEDAEVDARFARFFAQLGHLGDLQAAVFRNDNRLGVRKLRAHLGNYRFLLI
jgi:choline dehydrogenase-like flavoprotein